MEYMNDRISDLDAEKTITCADYENKSSKCDIDEISNYLEHWNKSAINNKITVVDSLIDRIIAPKERIEIKWKFS